MPTTNVRSHRRPIAAAMLALIAGHAAAQPEPTLDIAPARAAAMIEAMAPTNAALVYYQLFLQGRLEPMLAGVAHLTPDPDDDATASIDRDQAEAAFNEGQDVIANLMWAAGLPSCDFGVQYQQGWQAILPHLGNLRGAARVLVADARRQARDGDTEAAADRLEAVYHMARHVRSDGVLISSLVSMAMASAAHEAADELLASGRLTAPARDRLIAALERFGTDDPFHVRRCVRMEGVLTIGWITAAFPEGRAGSGLAAWGLLGDTPDPDTVARLDGMDASELAAAAERMLGYYRRTLEFWDGQTAVADIDALGRQVDDGDFGPLAEVFAASLGRARASDLRGQEALRAALTALRAYRPAEAGGATE